MTNRIELTEDQKKLLRKLLEAKTLYEQCYFMSQSIDGYRDFKKEQKQLEARAGAYDYVFHNALEELTGLDLDKLFPLSNDYYDPEEEEAELEAEASEYLEKLREEGYFTEA